MKRLGISIIILLIFGLILPQLKPVNAQQGCYPANDINCFSESVGQAGKGEGNKEGLDLHSLSDLEASLVCQIAGCSSDPSHPMPYNKSALASVTRYIDGMYQNPPASTYAFFLDTAQTLGFIAKPAYAQGIGFSGLSPLLPIWKIFRNVAYFFMAIVMVVIGFMVMLRKKIDPKTVVTVQNALPRIVITLILITFSYAIVGLMIDLMYLVILLFTALIKEAPFFPDVNWFQKLFGQPDVETTMTAGRLNDVFSLLFPYQAGPINITLTELAFHLTGGWQTSLVLGSLTGVIVGVLTLNPIAGAASGVAAAFTPAVLVSFLLSLALLFVFIRLFIMFLTAYINIILSLIIGPLQLLLEAIPGGGGFESWFKNLLANIAVFPVSAVMFLIALFFIGATRDLQGGGIWNPPFNLIGGNGNALAALFALGIMMVIPNVCGSIKEAIKAKEPIPVGPGVIAGPLFQGGMQAWNLAYQARMMGVWPRMEQRAAPQPEAPNPFKGIGAPPQ